MYSTFEIDIHDLTSLAKQTANCYNSYDMNFWDKLCDRYYKSMEPNERNFIYYEIVNSTEFISNPNIYTIEFDARYDPNNQYEVLVDYYGTIDTHNAYLLNDDFKINMNTILDDVYITDIYQIYYNDGF